MNLLKKLKQLLTKKKQEAACQPIQKEEDTRSVQIRTEKPKEEIQEQEPLLMHPAFEREDEELPARERQQEIFDAAKPGDFIFCLMPETYANRKNIPAGHDRRPYLITAKFNDCLFGYFVTTSSWKNCQYDEKLAINNPGFWSQKDSYILFKQMYKIPMDNILFPCGSLPKQSRHAVQRRITALENRDPNKVIIGLDEEIHPEPGDVVMDKSGNLDFLYARKETGFAACRLSHAGKQSNGLEITVRGDKYIAQTAHPLLLKEEDFVLYSFFSPSQAKEYIKQVQEWTKRRQPKEVEYSESKQSFKPKPETKNPYLPYFCPETLPLDYKYYPGTVILFGKQSESQWTYLYSIEGKDYGFCLDEIHLKNSAVRRMKHWSNPMIIGILQPEAMESVIAKVTKTSPDMKPYLNLSFSDYCSYLNSQKEEAEEPKAIPAMQTD